MDSRTFGGIVVSGGKQLNDSGKGLSYTPNLNTDISKFSKDIDKREIIFIADSSATTLGNLHVGMVASIDRLYFRNGFGETQSFGFDQIKDVHFTGKNRLGLYSPGDRITVLLKDGNHAYLEDCMNGFDCKAVEAFLRYFITAEFPNLSNTSLRSTLSLEDQPEQILLAYMKTLYNYAYVTDNEIEPSELSVLQSIAIRLDISAEMRSTLRSYMLNIDEREKTGNLLAFCRNRLSYGSYEIFRYSLMQDVLYINEHNKDSKPWHEDSFVNGIQKFLEITDQQALVMLSAIRLYKNLQKADVDYQSLEKDKNVLLNQAERLNIPLEAIFCSGSVYNVDTYHGLFRKQKQQRSIQKQRELMLQTVIRNSQITMNRLAEDMNDTTLKLLKYVQNGNERSKEINQLKRHLEKYAQQLISMDGENRQLRKEVFYSRLLPEVSLTVLNKEVQHGGHGFGLGEYSEARGWLDDAIKLWEANS